MSDRPLPDDVIQRIRDAEEGLAPLAENPEGFWKRLLQSLRVTVSGPPLKPKIEIQGGAEF